MGGSRRGRRSSRHSAGTSRLRAVVRAVTNPGGDAGDKAPFGPGDRAFDALSLSLCPTWIPLCGRQGGKSVCGIVGYVGKERCVEVLMEGLRHLEYRGYDSAGLALQRAGQIEQIKRGRAAREPRRRRCAGATATSPRCGPGSGTPAGRRTAVPARRTRTPTSAETGASPSCTTASSRTSRSSRRSWRGGASSSVPRRTPR